MRSKPPIRHSDTSTVGASSREISTAPVQGMVSTRGAMETRATALACRQGYGVGSGSKDASFQVACCSRAGARAKCRSLFCICRLHVADAGAVRRSDWKQCGVAALHEEWRDEA